MNDLEIEIVTGCDEDSDLATELVQSLLARCAARTQCPICGRKNDHSKYCEIGMLAALISANDEDDYF